MQRERIDLVAGARIDLADDRVVTGNEAIGMTGQSLDGLPALRHVAYCGELLHAGKALVFGPVADPAGIWGLGVLQLPDDADPQEIVANDPVTKANAGFTYQVMPMLRAATRESC